MAKIYDGMTNTAIKTFVDELKVHWTYSSNAIEGNTIFEEEDPKYLAFLKTKIEMN